VLKAEGGFPSSLDLKQNDGPSDGACRPRAAERTLPSREQKMREDAVLDGAEKQLSVILKKSSSG
jgi:hypothetical protein